MGLFSSKTKYYVASSSFPIFDDANRVNQFVAAMLDYTSNSQIEYSEYMRSYYSGSRLRHFQGFLNWWKTRGNFDVFGKVSGRFYGDASFNNVSVAEAVKKHVTMLEPQDTFAVYQCDLSYFSEDFWIKHLATEEGHASWFYQNNNLNYEIDYPTENTIKATFSDGRVIEGPVPDHTTGTRYLNISWSIVREEASTETAEDGTVSDVINFHYYYGYYCYQENSGDSELDEIISTGNTGTGTDDPYTFFPVIPLRSGTAWYSDENRRSRIVDALDYLEIFGQRSLEEDSYTRLQKACTEGMTSGSIWDVDYITMLLGICIGTTNQSDLRYMYEFWLNLHINYRLRNGEDYQDVIMAKHVYDGKGAWKTFVNNFLTVIQSNVTSGNFLINCAGSNLNYTYEWDGSDYFEANGKFRPDAKPGDYGVLSNALTHSWSERVLVKRVHIDGPRYRNIYETRTYSVDYSLTFFCRQVSVNRWRFVAYVNLGLINLVYHGKTIYTSAHSGVMDAAGKAIVHHTFDQDFPSAPGEHYDFDLYYVTSAADGNNAFIVPLEQNTFMEIGARNQLEISYGCQFLIFNCWEKKKIKWYQQGFFSIFVSFVGIVISGIIPLPTVSFVASTFFNVAFAVLVTAEVLEMSLKITQMIFGERLGSIIYTVVKTVITTIVCRVVGAIPVFGWAIAAAIMFTITAAEAINAGMSLTDAFKRGFISGAAMGAASVAANAVSGALSTAGFAASSAVNIGFTLGTQTAISSFGNALAGGESFGSALKTGLTQGIVAGVASGVMSGIGNALGFEDLTKSLSSQSNPLDASKLNGLTLTEKFSTVFMGEIVENPNTYVKLIGATMAEINYHKMANLENDYQEFADEYRAALQVLEFFYNQQSSLATAEFVCKLQSCIGRVLTSFPDMMAEMTPDSFITMSLCTGSDFCNSITQSVSEFVTNSLSMNGYEPDNLYYNQEYYWM